MSRTHKDKPSWTQVESYEPYHVCRRAHSRSWQRFIDDCTLPIEPPRLNRQNYGWTGPRHWHATCHWYVRSARRSQARYVRNKKSWRHLEYYGPVRAATRDAARRVLSGELEAVFPDGRARNSVLWDMC